MPRGQRAQCTVSAKPHSIAIWESGDLVPGGMERPQGQCEGDADNCEANDPAGGWFHAVRPKQVVAPVFQKAGRITQQHGVRRDRSDCPMQDGLCVAKRPGFAGR